MTAASIPPEPASSKRVAREARKFAYDSDTADLSWFFCEAAGSLGVCSSFGAMQNELARRSMSDQLRAELQSERAQRRPKPPRLDLSPLYKVFGMTAEPGAGTEVPEWAREYIKPHGRPSETAADVDFNEEAAGRMSHVWGRLVRLGSNWRSVLFAAYGPAARRWLVHGRGHPDHPVQSLGEGKPAPHLVEIAINVLEHRAFHDPSVVGGRACAANEKLWGKFRSSDLRNESRKLLDDAQVAYAFTRHPLWCRHCWPKS